MYRLGQTQTWVDLPFTSTDRVVLQFGVTRGVAIVTITGALPPRSIAIFFRPASFTGGPVTGEKIIKEAGLKKIAMDLGGNAPVIVMADCNLIDAAESCASVFFTSTLQR